MRMFLYYALHSFVNQLKKIFKTWVMVFILVCFVMGIGIGLLANTIEKTAQKNQVAVEETVEQEDEDEAPAQEKPNVIRDGIGYANFIELLAGGIILLSFVLSMINADKNAGKIFLPADVNLLFPSPLKPQSVMLFRIGMQLGTMIVMGVYMLFQLPNLVINAGLGIWAALALILAFTMTTFFGTLLQLLLYLLCSLSATFKKLMRPGITAILALVAGGYFVFRRTSGQDYLTAASNFFNGEASRWIPIWGWMKGFCRMAVDGNLGMALLFLALLVAGGALLVWIMWSLKVDFYEDAMAKSEEVAELMEAARNSSSGMAVRRKKDRSEKLRRDGIKHGRGASVFFFKNVYNRFRFAHFGIFSKTMEFYLFVAVAAGLVCRFAIKTGNVLLLVAVFGVITFFRSMGNALEADTKMAYFMMIPESTWMKMFYSLMAGMAETALDLSVPMIVGALIMGANPLEALVWVLALLSIYFFSVTVGTFIGVSVPTNAGQMVKQFAQILFIYFGLLPDIIILAFGVATKHLVLGIAGALGCNIVLGLIFFSLASLFLEPHGGSEPEAIL